MTALLSHSNFLLNVLKCKTVTPSPHHTMSETHEGHTDQPISKKLTPICEGPARKHSQKAGGFGTEVTETLLVKNILGLLNINLMKFNLVC